MCILENDRDPGESSTHARDREREREREKGGASGRSRDDHRYRRSLHDLSVR